MGWGVLERAREEWITWNCWAQQWEWSLPHERRLTDRISVLKEFTGRKGERVALQFLAILNPGKTIKLLDLILHRIPPPFFVFSLPSHSFGRCGTPRPAFLSSHKFTSSSLKLSILLVPDYQTSHRENRSEKSIHNMFLSIVFFANFSWDVCILEEWLFKEMIYLVGLSYARKKIMIWWDCPKKEGCVNVNTKWSMKTYKFQSDSMGIRFLLEFSHIVLTPSLKKHMDVMGYIWVSKE